MLNLPTLGPFQLQHPLGRGGMALVWRAWHAKQGQPVAVKIMAGETARKKRFVNSFHREVRAVARMNHPNIVQIYDYGSVDADSARLTEGQLEPGSPYFVMELASSSLSQIQPDLLSWPTVHTILAQVLDALAHAHARGLIHRDLKPDNILFAGDQDQARLRLADFGIAHSVNTERALRAEDDSVTGTPRYMAPEQIRGELRNQGPWTDLYALGCLAYWLVCGRHAFAQDKTEEVLRAHLSRARPCLLPIMEVPQELSEWIQRLLARDPSARFSYAADAARALASIAGSHPPQQVALCTVGEGQQLEELTYVADHNATLLLQPPPAQADSTPPGESSVASAPRVSGEFRSQDLPDDWRELRFAEDAPDLFDVGLSLFELREIPLVGRHQPRDQLWDMLRDTHIMGRIHLALLRGTAGVGKSRLARWLGNQAHQLGAAQVLTVHHSPQGGLMQGIGYAIATQLQCVGLPRERILARIRDFYGCDGALDADDLHQVAALTDLVSPHADPDFEEQHQGIHFTKPDQRWVVWARHLRRLAQRRPVLMIVDDIHWGDETLQFLDYLMGHSSRTAGIPLMAVLTARHDVSEESPMASALLGQILERPCTAEVELLPLSDPSHRNLVENLLHLDPSVGQEVIHRTAGNPLFAIQLVGDWVRRGLLVAGDGGFRLATDEPPPLPAGIREILIPHIEKIVGHAIDAPPSDTLQALELAAALGAQVAPLEWEHVCDLAGIAPADDALQALAAQSLVRFDDQGWSFAHGALRETLSHLAATQGRWRDHHRLAAQMLRERYGSSRRSMATRIALHLLEAHHFEAALSPLLDALDYLKRSNDFERGQYIFDLYEQTRQRIGLGDNDRRTIEGWLGALWIYRQQWKNERALDIATRCRAIARKHRWPELEARAAWAYAKVKNIQMELDEASEVGAEALALFRQVQDPRGEVRCLTLLAYIEFSRTDHDAMLGYCDQATELLPPDGDPLIRADLLICRGIALDLVGAPDKARQNYLNVLEIGAELGSKIIEGTCHNNLGEMARERGQFDKALTHYADAVDLYRQAGSGPMATPRLNTGMIHLERRDFDAALDAFEQAHQLAEQIGREFTANVSQAGRIACMAHRADWSAFDRLVDRLTTRLSETPTHDLDLAVCLELAAHSALDQGYPSRARKAAALAIAQWTELDEPERAAALEEELRPRS